MTCDIQICCPRAGQGAILMIASCKAKFKFGWAKNFARCFTRSIIEPETSTLEQCCTVLINMEDRESQPIVPKMLKQQQKHTKTIVSVKSSDVGLFHYESRCFQVMACHGPHRWSRGTLGRSAGGGSGLQMAFAFMLRFWHFSWHRLRSIHLWLGLEARQKYHVGDSGINSCKVCA